MTDQSKETELLPCPFCCEKPNEDQPATFNDWFTIECTNPKCMTSFDVASKIYQVAVNRWNTRSPDTAQLLKDQAFTLKQLIPVQNAMAQATTVMSQAGIPNGQLSAATTILHRLLARLSPQEQKDKTNEPTRTRQRHTHANPLDLATPS